MRYDSDKHRARSAWRLLGAGLVGCSLLLGCQGRDGGSTGGGGMGGGEPYRQVAGGDAGRGKATIDNLGCGACHMIPGIDDARGTVGPPLIYFGRRVFIAGEVPNTTAFLIQWIRAPQSIEPKTAMPNLGVTESQARDIAAYLYTLR